MPFLWAAVEDAPGPNSLGRVIERNAIAMLSVADINPPSSSWLRLVARDQAIRRSGPWNVDHTGEIYESRFFDVLREHVKAMHQAEANM